MAHPRIKFFKSGTEDDKYRYARVAEEDYKERLFQEHVLNKFIIDVSNDVKEGRLIVSPAATPTQSPVATPKKGPVEAEGVGEDGKQKVPCSLSQP
uniref:Uncharacterized protein n=1 Tax=Octopus bimaculoides TaxID=37653 RepID=A0A0L8HY50_OCTBM